MNKVSGQAGSFTIHQKLKLRVEPDAEEPFEVTLKQVFNDAHGQHIPQQGWSVKVIYDPSDHSRVVIDVDEMFVRPGVVDRDAAVARHEQALAMARDPEARAERIQRMQAEAMARRRLTGHAGDATADGCQVLGGTRGGGGPGDSACARRRR